MPINYKLVFIELCQKLGKKAVSNAYHRRLAWSTDASYFRIVPEVVVHANNLIEVRHCLEVANKYQAPITFRAAGTSLSGQAIGSGILLILGFDGFEQIEINADASKISLGTAVIGAKANQVLKPFNKKIGPDPATLNVAKIGGIVANNSSGMCCGTAQNTYQTIASAKLVFVDGTVLDTANALSKLSFEKSHGDFLQKLTSLAEKTKNNLNLSKRIKKKYAIKNTTGYSLNALVDFTDPFDIINHLIVGSEGTLAFVESVTYNTVEEAPFKASALAVFANIQDATTAIPLLKKQNISAAELLDYTSIKAIEGKISNLDWLSELPENAAMLLLETRAHDKKAINDSAQAIVESLSKIKTLRPVDFTYDEKIYQQYWAMRSSLYPVVAGNRKKGTSVIIEDIAFNTADLAKATQDLTALFHQHGYPEGVIFGHALAGNIHFIITPAFKTEKNIEQFRAFMQNVTEMVINKYDGSMKAEHGTGRAVAPFVEMEWGAEAYQLMKQIKHLFDPKNLLNPGVILNDDKNAHIHNIKPVAKVNELIDKCIDCGFCEKTCPTSALTMSPRQRIATLREMSRLENIGEWKSANQLRAKAKYDVVDTCISCELCNIACPVDIGMGELAHQLRAPDITSFEQKKLDLQAAHFAKTNQLIRTGLNLVDLLHHTAGNKATDLLIKTARKFNKEIPNWNASFPKASYTTKETQANFNRPKVIYFPACGGRIFGATPQDKNNLSLENVVEKLLNRAGFTVVKLENTKELCCGQLWQSKGDMKNADAKHNELITNLVKISKQGRHPIIVDALSCTYRTLSANSESKLKIIDLIDFIHDDLLEKLSINQKKSAITLHLGCSARKLEVENKMQKIVDLCAEHVVYPEGIDCCGYAGEKGLYLPEISANSLRHIKKLLPPEVKEGYYANRMCELGLTQHSDISYRHLAYLVEECSR